MLVRQLFSLWCDPLPLGMTSMEIMTLADTLIGQFWKVSSDSLRFAPSTIAIAALLLAFSKCKMDCSFWLQRLPNELLLFKSSSLTPHPIFALHELSFLDIDGCLVVMTKEDQTSKVIPTNPDILFQTPPGSPDKRRRIATPTTVMTMFSDDMMSST